MLVAYLPFQSHAALRRTVKHWLTMPDTSRRFVPQIKTWRIHAKVIMHIEYRKNALTIALRGAGWSDPLLELERRRKGGFKLKGYDESEWTKAADSADVMRQLARRFAGSTTFGTAMWDEGERQRRFEAALAAA